MYSFLPSPFHNLSGKRRHSATLVSVTEKRSVPLPLKLAAYCTLVDSVGGLKLATYCTLVDYFGGSKTRGS